MSYLVLSVVAALGWHVGGWWLLAVVAFAGGVLWRTRRWAAVRIGAVAALVGALRLAWLAWGGAPIRDAGALTAAVTSLPPVLLWVMALVLPALVALCAAAIGTVAGRKFMFG